MKFVIGALFLAMLLYVTTDSQTAPSAAMSAANELLKQQKYSEAAVAFEAIVKGEPQNGQAWYQLASADYYLKNYPAAATAYEKNIALSQSAFAMYNLAGIYSLMGEKQKALDWLDKALNSPKMVLAVANFDDADFTNIKNEAGFIALRDKTDRKVRPCMYSAAAKQLDFWVGEWEVYNPQGRHDGSSVVQSFASGCGVLENWTGTFGGGGKSINFYDPDAGKWFQYWMGANGAPFRYSGSYRDGAMRYESETAGPDGTKRLAKLTFFNIDANTVRQLAENSSDGGKTWSISYDYKYVRRKSSK